MSSFFSVNMSFFLVMKFTPGIVSNLCIQTIIIIIIKLNNLVHKGSYGYKIWGHKEHRGMYLSISTKAFIGNAKIY